MLNVDCIYAFILLGLIFFLHGCVLKKCSWLRIAQTDVNTREKKDNFARRGALLRGNIICAPAQRTWRKASTQLSSHCVQLLLLPSNPSRRKASSCVASFQCGGKVRACLEAPRDALLLPRRVLINGTGGTRSAHAPLFSGPMGGCGS